MTARMVSTPAAALPRRRPAPEPALRVVTDGELAADGTRRLHRRLALTATVAAVLCVFAVVVAQVAITQEQFRLQRLEREAAERQATYDRLRLKVAELESPARVVAAARDLGLVDPPEVQYLTPAAGSGPAPSPTAHNPATSWSTVKPLLAEG